MLINKGNVTCRKEVVYAENGVNLLQCNDRIVQAFKLLKYENTVPSVHDSLIPRATICMR
ncbi:hypothetical protein WH47_03961 [Habropoda laboriosa]|uniref:Uncharacterized protein n=1 Tax=Habropoda laboriosa TaxID=597456 RepID=A0A0L7QU83_9HYME|nr:hypothetical protein WH47_03961 [Habropoda laboriosa]